MEFEGKVWKDGKIWLIEVPALNLMTQGKSRKNALEMIRDATMGLIHCDFESTVQKDFTVTLVEINETTFRMTTNQNELLQMLSKRRCSE